MDQITVLSSEVRANESPHHHPARRSAPNAVCAECGGNRIRNFPEQHSKNCTAKHQATKGNFKPMVRVFKNMRNSMIEKKLLADGIAPSYFIEGMLWNVPPDKFRWRLQRYVRRVLQLDRER